MRDLVRAEQRAHLDAAAYRLLRRLETDLEAESLEIVRYYRACEHFRLCLWAQLMLPVASFKPDDDSRRVPPRCLRVTKFDDFLEPALLIATEGSHALRMNLERR